MENTTDTCSVFLRYQLSHRDGSLLSFESNATFNYIVLGFIAVVKTILPVAAKKIRGHRVEQPRHRQLHFRVFVFLLAENEILFSAKELGG